MATFAFTSIDTHAQEYNISQDKLLEIEAKVNSMPSIELIDQKAKLLSEVQDLENEQQSSVSPERLSSISTRLSEIFAELSMIEAALAVIGSEVC